MSREKLRWVVHGDIDLINFILLRLCGNGFFLQNKVELKEMIPEIDAERRGLVSPR